MTIDAAIATNRFGLGARPGEIALAQADPRGWLEEQIRGTRADAPALQGLPKSADIFRIFEDVRAERREAHDTPQKQTQHKTQAPMRANNPVREKLVPVYLEQVAARYRFAASTTEAFRERLVHFWTNHFAVSADKQVVLALAGTLENEAIRPNVSRRFVDMLLAVEAHPAMILYLDNQASIGPHSALAQRAAKRAQSQHRTFDINENLAREILELHTLGVAGGYTQADVTSFAQALTGWSVGTSRGPLAGDAPGQFEFRSIAHEPGAKTIMGKRFAQDALAQPRGILESLARHPATATHIATKLVRHFVADVPASQDIERVAKVFRDTDGSLPEVHAALVHSPAAWTAQPTKYKSPHEFVVSTMRAFDTVPAQPRQIAASFTLLGQRPYAPGSPAGWPDVASEWDGSDALLNRIEWATQVGERVHMRADPVEVATSSLAAALSDRTRTAIARAASAAQGFTLFLASPEFQRR